MSSVARGYMLKYVQYYEQMNYYSITFINTKFYILEKTLRIKLSKKHTLDVCDGEGEEISTAHLKVCE